MPTVGGHHNMARSDMTATLTGLMCKLENTRGVHTRASAVLLRNTAADAQLALADVFIPSSPR